MFRLPIYNAPMKHTIRQRHFLRLLILGTLTTSGCAVVRQSGSPLLPMPKSAQHEPDDMVLVDAIRTYLAVENAPSYSRYDYRRIDLNHDGKRDALVLLNAPYYHWCRDDNGCTMVVFEAHETQFTPVTTIAPVRQPVLISPDSTTNGWSDIIIHVSGRPQKTKDVKLSFDGKGYPSFPDSLPAFTVSEPKKYTKIFKRTHAPQDDPHLIFPFAEHSRKSSAERRNNTGE